MGCPHFTWGKTEIEEVKFPKDTADQGQRQNSVKLQSWKKKYNLCAESQYDLMRM